MLDVRNAIADILDNHKLSEFAKHKEGLVSNAER
jgi:hypothetical protein